MEKIKDGKLLRVRVDFDKGINKVQIIGDFFAYPEESIEEIEKNLSKLSLDFDEQQEIDNLRKFVEKNNIQLVGLNEESIIKSLKRAIEI